MENLLEKLELQEKEIIEAGKRLYHAYHSIYPFDLYCLAQLNRSINLLNGFIQLAKSDNFITAFALVRIHLDTLQRIFAFHLISKNPDEIVVEIQNGKKLNQFQSKKSKRKLNDSVLAQELSEEEGFEWVKGVYEAGNNFVHFSDKHLLSTTITNNEERSLSSTIAIGSKLIENSEKEGSVIYMAKITEAIIFFIDNWSEQKKTYPL